MDVRRGIEIKKEELELIKFAWVQRSELETRHVLVSRPKP